MTIRSAVLLALLISTGFLGDYYTIPLFFGADFLFGSIAVLLVLYFYGLTWGMLAALVAYSYTWVLWGHPYGFINFMSEALFVGLFLKWGRRNLLALDAVFWLLLGAPLAWLYHGVALHMDATTASFIMLKQSINGIFNAMLVSLAIYYLPLGKLFPRPQLSTEFSLRDSLFSLLVMLVLLPALLLTMLETRKAKENLEAEVIANLQSLSANLQFHLHSWCEHRIHTVQELAKQAAASSMTRTDRLQYETNIMKRGHKDLRALHVINAAGRTIIFSPEVNEKGESNIGWEFSDRLWFKEPKAKQQPMVGDVFLGKTAFPDAHLLVVSAPVFLDNRWAGIAGATLDLTRLQEMLKPYSQILGKVAITLTDSKGQIVVSTLPGRTAMQIWGRKTTGAFRPLNASIYHWYPDDPKLPSITRWKQSFYVQEIPLRPELPWKLTAEAPVAPLQHTLYTIYVKNLAIMAILMGLALLFSLLLSRWLSRPLVQLSQVTADLPEKLSEAQNLDWPDSSALEIHSLIVNFQSMAHALEQNFYELRERSAELVKANEELQTEINDRRRAEEAVRESEQQLLNIINFLPDATFVIDREGKVIAWNKAIEEMTGVKAQDMIGKGNYEYALPFYGARRPILIDLVLNPQAEIDSKYLELIEREDLTIVGEAYMPVLRGGEAYLRGTASVLCDSSGNIIGAIESIRDITERHKVKEALQRSEEKYRGLMDNSSEGILLADIQGNFLEANKKMEALLGYTKAELLHMNLTQIHPPEELARTVAVFQEIAQKGRGAVLNGRVIRKDGKGVPVDITGSRVEYAGKIIMQGIFRDMTERQKAEAERLRFSKLESLGILAGGLAHDFNNILTAILGNISLAMLDRQKEDHRRERLAEAERACLQLQTLARQLLTFAKGGAPIKELVSVEKLITESASFACRGTHVRCEFSLLDNLWVAEADPGQISQVFQNLVINAIQAMPTGGTIKVQGENLVVKAHSDLPLGAGKYVKISIQDQGVGIPADHLDRIFDPYFTTKQTGSGLGLATTYSIINSHHGHISVESTLGVGTTFYIYLPAVAEKIIKLPDPEREVLTGQGKILVMDDEEMVRQLLDQVLGHLGYEAEFAQDGGEAIKLFTLAQESGKAFDAVILDLTVPGGMGGKETIEKLLKIDPQVKAIVSSGYFDDPIMAEFAKYGFSGVIAKPYRISELSRVLNKVISKVK